MFILLHAYVNSMIDIFCWIIFIRFFTNTVLMIIFSNFSNLFQLIAMAKFFLNYFHLIFIFCFVSALFQLKPKLSLVSVTPLDILI